MAIAESDTAFDYGDLLGDAGGGWKRRLLWLTFLGVAGAAALVSWYFFFRSGGGGETAVESTTAQVALGSIAKSISTSGTVAAKQTSDLSFEGSGEVTQVHVTMGQQVKAGDVLAEIDPADAQRALDTARVGLQVAQAKLDDLLDGASAADLASADQSVAAAQSSYDKAVRAMEDLLEPPTSLELAAALQDVTAAQAKLQQANEARTRLGDDAATAVSTAEDALNNAQDALDKAESDAADAESEVSSTQAALYSAEDDYCAIDSSPSFCSGHDAPIASADEATLVSSADSGTPTQAQAATKALNANTSYRNAVSAAQAAGDAIEDAGAAVDDAQDTLDEAEEAPSVGEIASADAAVSGAQLAVDQANDALADLQAGRAQDDIDDAQDAIDSAAVSLASAEAKRDETYAGAETTEILQQRESVKQAQNTVEEAQEALDATKLVAPYDGTVAEVDIEAGDTVGGGAGSSSSSTTASAAIVLNTPDALVLDLTISESDYTSVKVGQTGVATFEAITDGFYPFVIESVGTVGTTTQGVVTYQAAARLMTSPTAGGMPGGFQRRAGATSPPPAGAVQATPGVNVASTPTVAGTAMPAATPSTRNAAATGAASTPAATVTAAAKPAVGMNATVTIVTEQAQNALTVPSRAVQQAGTNTYVEVQAEDGTISQVTVTTGLSDDTNTEITSGLDEGQTVVVPGRSTITASSTSTSGLPSFPDGGGFQGGPPPGGGAP